MTTDSHKQPQVDEAEFNAFFPSKYSLEQFTSPKSDLEGADYPQPYTGEQRILIIASDERYVPMANGTYFSTGNHPIETLLPMYHLHKAGFKFDIATLSGNMVKFEYWAMPKEDEEINGLYQAYYDEFHHPMKLSDVVENLGQAQNYAAVFIPGGHAPLVNIPFSQEVDQVLRWALENDRYIISICHGPAALLACASEDSTQDFPFAGYTITAFPDAIDRKTPEMGYMPGDLTWYFGEKLKALGVKIANTEPDKSTHKDRKLLTGASPFAANDLGKLVAKTLLEDLAAK